MKCLFDGSITSMDSILLNLYKRIYPKWTFEPQVALPPVSNYTPTPNITMDTHDATAELFDQINDSLIRILKIYFTLDIMEDVQNDIQMCMQWMMKGHVTKAAK